MVARREGLLSVHATGTCTGARTAYEQAAENCPESPIAVGVDAPLFWVLDGDRRSDVLVRKIVSAAGGSSGTVNHVNSLRGACLVQGVQVARLVHDRWPGALVTEAHPKALLAASEQARDLALQVGRAVKSEHERDAVLAAYSSVALATSEPGWHNLAALESVPYFPGGTRVAYWFPRMRT